MDEVSETTALIPPDHSDGTRDADPQPVKRIAVKRIITVEPVVFMSITAYIAMIPLSEQYVYSHYAHIYGISDTRNSVPEACDPNATQADHDLQTKVQQKSSLFMVILNFCVFAGAIPSCIVLGAYSDNAGRKWSMIISLLGGVFRTLTFVIVTSLDLSMYYLLAGNLVDGIMGSVTGVQMASFAYIADITTADNRSFRILVLEIAIGIGVMSSNLSVGYLIKAIGFVYPFLFAMILYTLGFLYVIVLLPETVYYVPGTKLFDLKHFSTTLQLLTKETPNKRRNKLILNLILLTSVAMVEIAMPDVQALRAFNFPLCLNSVLYGYYVAEQYLCKDAGSIVLMKFGLKRIGRNGLLIIGCVSFIVYNIGYGLAWTPTVLFFGK